MSFLIKAFIPNKPAHNNYVFKNLNETQYIAYAKTYSRAKAGGIRGIYGWATGLGVWGIAKDVVKGMAIDYGKRKLCFVIITGCTYISSSALVVVTNSSKLLKLAKSVHGTAAYIFECLEDTSNLSFLPVDLLFFGQLIPVGAEDRFNCFNSTDFMNY